MLLFSRPRNLLFWRAHFYIIIVQEIIFFHCWQNISSTEPTFRTRQRNPVFRGYEDTVPHGQLYEVDGGND